MMGSDGIVTWATIFIDGFEGFFDIVYGDDWMNLPLNGSGARMRPIIEYVKVVLSPEFTNSISPTGISYTIR